MKLILIFLFFIPLILAIDPNLKHFEVISANQTIKVRQKKVICLMNHLYVNRDIENECYRHDKNYEIKGNENNYDPVVVSEFFETIKNGSLTSDCVFTIFDDTSRSEAVALYKLFMSAKDFGIFYKTGVWAKRNLHPDLFSYTFTAALLKRKDTHKLVVPNPYETNPYYFTSKDVIERINYIIKRNYSLTDEEAQDLSILKSENNLIIYANYSRVTGDKTQENKLSYLTEDVGWNAYYYYFHILFASWLNSSDFSILQNRRGELFFNFHQQLIARYNLERLSNGLEMVSELSWDSFVNSRYSPSMVNHANTPFVERKHVGQSLAQEEILKFLKKYDREYFELMNNSQSEHTGHSLTDPEKTEVASTMTTQNLTMITDAPLFHGNKYEDNAHILMSGPSEKRTTCRKTPVAVLDFQTALRDPLFYRFQKHILNNELQLKKRLKPYSKEDLSFPEVKISEVIMTSPVTYFSFFDFNVTNVAGLDHNSVDPPSNLTVRQARLDQRFFEINVTLEVTGTPTVMMKTFLAPAGTIGNSTTDNWMNFYEIDSYKTTLDSGHNIISRDTLYFFSRIKDDGMIPLEFLNWLDFGKIAIDMAQYYHQLPRRLVFPRGTETGFPVQLFMIVYPYEKPDVDITHFNRGYFDNKSLGYPFDRPVDPDIFTQKNCFVKDIFIHHSGLMSVGEYTRTGFENKKGPTKMG